MRVLLKILGGLFAILAVVIVAALAYIYAPGGAARLESRLTVPPTEPIDFATLRKVDKPNQFLVCPAGTCSEKPDQVSRTYPVALPQLRSAWDAMIKKQVDTTLLLPDTGTNQLTYVQRTKTVRYPDLITVQFFENGSASTLAIYSRSIYGHGDGGVNKKRVETWLAGLDAELGSEAGNQ
jgi:uncharacterized protein (DUF1499 family)